ncbi:hypothetical protein H6P81_002066 [Aristolochia fimbriata]|uniref:Uncharacterized protein n=1 Tax=Aristolochia fimbriata TaxID=158543 RepID=A0AAV7F9D1_ARIFI|nr:hypothetical protein H6P81_002066 [Aristolochia fimbriata]
MATEAQISFLSRPILANGNVCLRPSKGHIASLFRRPTALVPSICVGKQSTSRPDRCPVVLECRVCCKTARSEEENHLSVEVLKVPDRWLVPSRARENCNV